MRYYSQYDDLVGIIDEYKIGWTAQKLGGILSFEKFWIIVLLGDNFRVIIEE